MHHISKTFKTLTALDDIDFNIETGDFFALLGPNGAGKTTLISILAGLRRQDTGHATIMGYDTITNPYKARMHLGVVPQELTFDPFFTVQEALVLQSGYFGFRKNKAWIDEILDRLALTNQANATIRALSGGTKRRFMIAQALVHKPSVIILDEPTAGVDIELRRSLWLFTQELNRMGHTILLTTHYLEEAEALCHNIAILKKGKLVLLEEKDKLLQHTKQRYLTLRLSKPLPSILTEKLVRHEADGSIVLRLNHMGELENIMAVIRQNNAEVKTLTLNEIKLEDVFMGILNQDKTT